jgi:hypothetical protein
MPKMTVQRTHFTLGNKQYGGIHSQSSEFAPPENIHNASTPHTATSMQSIQIRCSRSQGVQAFGANAKPSANNNAREETIAAAQSKKLKRLNIQTLKPEAGLKRVQDRPLRYSPWRRRHEISGLNDFNFFGIWRIAFRGCRPEVGRLVPWVALTEYGKNSATNSLRLKTYLAGYPGLAKGANPGLCYTTSLRFEEDIRKTRKPELIRMQTVAEGRRFPPSRHAQWRDKSAFAKAASAGQAGCLCHRYRGRWRYGNIRARRQSPGHLRDQFPGDFPQVGPLNKTSQLRGTICSRGALLSVTRAGGACVRSQPGWVSRVRGRTGQCRQRRQQLVENAMNDMTTAPKSFRRARRLGQPVPEGNPKGEFHGRVAQIKERGRTASLASRRGSKDGCCWCGWLLLRPGTAALRIWATRPDHCHSNCQRNIGLLTPALSSFLGRRGSRPPRPNACKHERLLRVNSAAASWVTCEIRIARNWSFKCGWDGWGRLGKLCEGYARRGRRAGSCGCQLSFRAAFFRAVQRVRFCWFGFGRISGGEYPPLQNTRRTLKGSTQRHPIAWFISGLTGCAGTGHSKCQGRQNPSGISRRHLSPHEPWRPGRGHFPGRRGPAGFPENPGRGVPKDRLPGSRVLTDAQLLPSGYRNSRCEPCGGNALALERRVPTRDRTNG